MDEKEQTKANSIKKKRIRVKCEDLTNDREQVSKNPQVASTSPSAASLLSTEDGLTSANLDAIPEGCPDAVKIQFLNTQVLVLRNELQNVVKECVEKEEKIAELKLKLKTAEQETAKLFRECSNKQKNVEKYQKISENSANRIAELESQSVSMKEEIEQLKLSQKQISSGKRDVDLKLSRALGEMEKLKSDLCLEKKYAEEAKDKDKVRILELTADNIRLQKETTELFRVFKKQMRLIDNLKKQKMHLEAAKALAFTEEEFMRALDWNTSTVGDRLDHN